MTEHHELSITTGTSTEVVPIPSPQSKEIAIFLAPISLSERALNDPIIKNIVGRGLLDPYMTGDTLDEDHHHDLQEFTTPFSR